LLTPAEVAERIRMNIIGLQPERSMFRFELALRANFNPSQPRVPAGNSDGSRWTRVGGPLGSGPSRTSRPTEPVAGYAGDGTVCVHDIKTGKRGLGFARATEIARKVFGSFSSAKRITIIETRPTR